MDNERPPVDLAPSGLVGDDLARALVARKVDRTIAYVDGRCRRGGFREGLHSRPLCGPSYERRTKWVELPSGRGVDFRGHVRGAVEMMFELGVIGSTDEVVALAMLSLANEFGLLSWANQRKIGRRAHVSARTVRTVQRKLRALGLVDWSHEFRNGRPYPNRYVFSLPAKWTRTKVLAAKKRVGDEPVGRRALAEWCAQVVNEVMNPTRSPRPRPPASKLGPGRAVTSLPAGSTDRSRVGQASASDDDAARRSRGWAEVASESDWSAVLDVSQRQFLKASVGRRGSAARAAVVEAVAARLRAGLSVPGPSP